MKVYRFTVPQDKAGGPQMCEFEGELAKRFGGYTRFACESVWQDRVAGRKVLVSDAVFMYEVAVPIGQSLGPKLREFVLAALRQAGEKAAYFAAVGTAEVIQLKGEVLQ